ncbi:hypothetical protein NQ317_013732 [Molorchus minor]|uniref:Uncharacterized protein n=1 Tax=Molorchus minor TaxID=1323400 RepID=A0ABQ9JP05_9CUCU|nr:hypothetical protein NQ317_013732 [Molorchus minor]
MILLEGFWMSADSTTYCYSNLLPGISNRNGMSAVYNGDIIKIGDAQIGQLSKISMFYTGHVHICTQLPIYTNLLQCWINSARGPLV